MSIHARLIAALTLAMLVLAPPAFAESSNAPSSSEVSQQFSSGANRVGQGATQIGEGIKNGAIMTWDAIKNGAQAFANSFSKERTVAPVNNAQSK